MAVSSHSNVVRMNGNGDVLNAASLGSDEQWVNGITITAGATPGALEIRVGGTTGAIIWSKTPAANSSEFISFASPQRLFRLATTGAMTNVEVFVFLATR